MGGLAGHLSHVYEDMGMKFSTFKKILYDVATGTVDTYEKVDGQNIFFGYDLITNIAKFARNKTEIKKGGLSLNELKEKFAGRGTVEEAFVYGGTVIENALKSLQRDDLELLFNKPNTYINSEIMYVNNPNLIIYNGNYIVLHGATRYNENGNASGSVDREVFDKFAKILSSIESSDSKWSISKPTLTAINNITNKNEYIEIISRLDNEISQYGLSDNDTIADYCFMRLSTNILPRMGIPANLVIDITKRIMRLDDAPTVVQLKKGKPKELQSLISSIATTKFAKKFLAEAYYPLSDIVLDYSTELFKDIMSFFSTKDKEEIEILQKAVAIMEKYINNIGDDKQQEKLKKEMNKLKDVNRITTDIEGVVFRYPPGTDNLYKFTGTFAPVNQILGIMGFEIKDTVMKKARKEVKIDKEEDSDNDTKEIILELIETISHETKSKNRKLYIDDKLEFPIEKLSLMSDFCNYCADNLPIDNDFEVYVVSQKEPYGIKTTAHYQPGDQISTVYGKNRSLVDILRSIAHEMTHMMQDEKGLLHGHIQDAGGFHEDQANARAGELIKRFAKSMPERSMIYENLKRSIL